MEEFVYANEEIKYIDKYYSNSLENTIDLNPELKKEKEIFEYSIHNRKNEITAFKLANKDLIKDDVIRDKEHIIRLGNKLLQESLERLDKQSEERIKELQSRKEE